MTIRLTITILPSGRCVLRFSDGVETVCQSVREAMVLIEAVAERNGIGEGARC